MNKRQLDNNCDERVSKRARIKTKRFGQRESIINYNDYFENDSDINHNEIPNESTNEDIYHHTISQISLETNNSISNEFCNCNSSDSYVEIICASLNVTVAQIKKLKERIKVMERKVQSCSSIHNGDKENRNGKPSANFNLEFSFPIENPQIMEQFELRLKHRPFKMLMISWLSKKKRSFLLTKQPLRLMIHMLITPGVLCNYTWTGKTSTIKKLDETESKDKIIKDKFNRFVEIQDTLWQAMKSVKKNYTWNEFKNDLIYKVLKYAYRNSDEDMEMVEN